jgi:[protein-PII] uridylyltransferase
MSLTMLDRTQTGDTAKAFRLSLREADQALQQRFLNGAPVRELLHERAALIDGLLLEVWAKAWGTTASDRVALVAVGGYGRGELHPFSDIDLLILLGQDQHDTFQPPIERFIGLLWDIGLQIGHSVRSVQECVDTARQDITIATTLMEARLLSGPAGLFDSLRTAIGPDRIWPVKEFFEAKWQEQIRRHHKYHDTAYNLEPNIKDGPGGLRDIQTLAWVTQRHFGSSSLHDLIGHGFLTEGEYALLIEGQDFLWRIRYALHVTTDRREDRLVFDHQRTLAAQFGYQNHGPVPAVEQFMKRYYRTVMELSRLSEMLLQHFQEAILYAGSPHQVVRINKRFQTRDDFIEVSHDKVFKHYPFALLEIFLLLAQHPEIKGVRASTIRLIRDHRHLIDETFRADLRCRTLFMELLRQPHGIAHELSRMNRYGILAAYLPAFGNIVGQMQHDLFHVYTVDEHTLFLVRNLRRYSVPEYAHEFPLCSSLFQRLPKPEILYLAGLFHDIAKGRGGDHSELGADDATAFCLLHGMSQYDARLVAWLVKHHLIMSTTAQRYDIADPNVVNTFAGRVGDQVHLDYLYLLTAADIRATNPALWNSWKDALLTELYLSTTRALRRGLEHPIDQAELIRETQHQALVRLLDLGVDETAVENFWRELGDEYFLRYSADEIAWHTQAISSSYAIHLPLILIRQRTERGGTEIFIYTHDQDRLFAATAGALDQLGLTIVDARIITARNGYTVNTYIVLEESGEPIDNPHRIEEITALLKRQLAQSPLPAPPVTRRTRRQLRHFPIPTQITFSDDPRNRRTVLEIVTADRPGLLSDVGRAFVDCKIRLQNAKIATFGARAEDIFFITDIHNRPITSEPDLARLRDTLIRYLDKCQ